LNGLGSLGIFWISLRKRAFQPALVNAVWLLTTLFAAIYHIVAH
jgi:hypothetical protein